jgi:hypothetical protein
MEVKFTLKFLFLFLTTPKIRIFLSHIVPLKYLPSSSQQPSPLQHSAEAAVFSTRIFFCGSRSGPKKCGSGSTLLVNCDNKSKRKFLCIIYSILQYLKWSRNFLDSWNFKRNRNEQQKYFAKIRWCILPTITKNNYISEEKMINRL